MALDFKDRVAIVTGAGGGLGRLHALALAKRGARLVHAPTDHPGEERFLVQDRAVDAGPSTPTERRQEGTVEPAAKLLPPVPVLDLLVLF